MMKKIFNRAAVGSVLSVLGLGVMPANAAAISPQAKSALLAALDDEYKAQATYQAVMARHGQVKPFSNIIHAEKRHADAVKKLLRKYRVAVPGNKYIKGGKSTISVPASLKASCETGVTAEIENVKLYDNKLLPAVRAYPDITSVMKSLRNASQHKHLQAFKRCVERGGKMGGGRGMGGQGKGGQGKGMGRSKGGQGKGMGQGRRMGNSL